MEIRQLEMFVAVCDTRSFTDAAKKCCVSQSAVSQQVRALEDEIGSPLFIRKGHSIEITEHGDALYAHAKIIIREVKDASEHVTGIHEKMSGTLRIGVGAFVEQFIKHACMEMVKRYPDVMLRIEFEQANRLNTLLRSHDIDLAFSMNTAHKDEGIVTEPCIPFKLCAIMNNTHPLAKKDILTVEEITKHRVVLLDAGDRVFDTLKRYIDADLSRMKIVAVMGCAEACLGVASELGLITFMPASYIVKRPNMVAIPIQNMQMDLISNAHYMADVPMKRTVKAFLEIIRESSIPYVKMTE